MALFTVLSPEELRRTARQLALPGFGITQQEQLHNAHVLVIGAGGLGCPAMQSLASAGVGTITVIDDDVVDISNIHRQILFGAQDVGHSKVEVAAQRLQQLQPGIKVNPLHERITTANAVELLQDVDLVLDGSDSFSTKYLVADAAEITSTPLVWATVLRFHGEVALFHSGQKLRGVGLRDVFPIQPGADFVPDCATAGVLGATTATIGALMATHAIGVLTGRDDVTPGMLLSYDAFPAGMRSFNISADPARPLVKELAENYGDPTCAVNSATTADQEEAQRLLNAVQAGNMCALDIREPHEVVLKDLPHDIPTIKLPLSTITSEAELKEQLAGIEQDIVVYCASSKRSADFVRTYAHLEHQLFSLPGGVNAL